MAQLFPVDGFIHHENATGGGRWQTVSVIRSYGSNTRQWFVCFRGRHKDLIYPSGRRGRGNSAATAFWRGYDGALGPVWDARSRQTPAYACFRAGEDVKALVAAGIYDDVAPDWFPGTEGTHFAGKPL